MDVNVAFKTLAFSLNFLDEMCGMIKQKNQNQIPMLGNIPVISRLHTERQATLQRNSTFHDGHKKIQMHDMISDMPNVSAIFPLGKQNPKGKLNQYICVQVSCLRVPKLIV